jgi:nicotinate-nucleotide adenylyltransferase
MRVEVFGGSFNPPHLGHQQMTSSILKNEIADEVWYLPVALHDFGKEVIDPALRCAMLNLILPTKDEPFFEQVRVENCELRRGGVSYSAETLDYLSSRYPQHQFSFLIGSDNLAKFHLWDDQKGRNFNYLIDNYSVHVYPRSGHPFAPFYPNLVSLEGLPEVDVSSTQVRAALAAGVDNERLAELLDPKIINYIRERGLYGNS